MKAFILAAGRGERMRPLTDTVPKPLLEVGGFPLIVHTIRNLARAGISELIINLTHLGEQIETSLGNGSQWGVKIHYSYEKPALETAGGIVNVLPLLGNEPFLLVNGDIWTDFDYTKLVQMQLQAMAHLVMVSNPSHHPQGDFCLKNGMLVEKDGEQLTYSGIGLYSPELFKGFASGIRPLAPVLHKAISNSQLSAEWFEGQWWDVGTPERLQQLDQLLS